MHNTPQVREQLHTPQESSKLDKSSSPVLKHSTSAVYQTRPRSVIHSLSKYNRIDSTPMRQWWFNRPVFLLVDATFTSMLLCLGFFYQASAKPLIDLKTAHFLNAQPCLSGSISLEWFSYLFLEGSIRLLVSRLSSLKSLRLAVHLPKSCGVFLTSWKRSTSLICQWLHGLFFDSCFGIAFQNVQIMCFPYFFPMLISFCWLQSMVSKWSGSPEKKNVFEKWTGRRVCYIVK